MPTNQYNSNPNNNKEWLTIYRRGNCKTNKTKNRCSDLLVIKMQINTREKHITLFRPTKVKMLKNAKCNDEDVEHRLIHPLQGRIWQFLVKSTLCISYDLTLPPMSTFSKEILIQTQKKQI